METNGPLWKVGYRYESATGMVRYGYVVVGASSETEAEEAAEGRLEGIRGKRYTIIGARPYE